MGLDSRQIRIQQKDVSLNDVWHTIWFSCMQTRLVTWCVRGYTVSQTVKQV